MLSPVVSGILPPIAGGESACYRRQDGGFWTVNPPLAEGVGFPNVVRIVSVSNALASEADDFVSLEFQIFGGDCADGDAVVQVSDQVVSVSSPNYVSS